MLGGSKSEIGEEGRCLCTISLNKAAVVRVRPEEHQGPFTERKEMLETLFFISASTGWVYPVFYQLCYSVRQTCQEIVGGLNSRLGGYMFYFILLIRTYTTQINFSYLKLTHRNDQQLPAPHQN